MKQSVAVEHSILNTERPVRAVFRASKRRFRIYLSLNPNCFIRIALFRKPIAVRHFFAGREPASAVACHNPDFIAWRYILCY
jgi:hypothetical protein